MVEIRPLMVLALLLASVGILGNTLVVVLFLKSRSLRKPINFFLIALAFSDMTMLAAQGAGPYIREANESEDVCIAMSSLYVSQCQLSVNCFAATAVLRYILILHPGLSQRLTTWAKCTVFLALILLADFLIIWPMWIGWIKSKYSEVLGGCGIDQASDTGKIYGAVMVLISLGVPNTAIVYCYVSIFVKRWQSQRRVQSQVSSQRAQPAFKGKD